MVFSRFGGDLLSHVLRRSTIGAVALNDRVRNGSGCFAHAMTTKPRKNHCRDAAMVLVGVSAFAEQMSREPTPNHARCGINQLCCPGQAPVLRCSMLFVLGEVFFNLAVTGSNQAYRTISTGQLNTLLCLHLRPIDVVVFHGPQGYLVLRGASRLDAFSGYPVRS